uniref:Transposase n=1 Tax=Cupriavidus taiwanensis TaxID=164546 RepID=A0A375HF92_9BURK|nr:protein of unknown function [Cupriavidus taiwanensis]
MAIAHKQRHDRVGEAIFQNMLLRELIEAMYAPFGRRSKLHWKPPDSLRPNPRSARASAGRPEA